MSSLNSGILEYLECGVCLCYMTFEIHLCERGHSFCGRCTEQLLCCPNCKGRFLGARNYNLENVASCLYYPCYNSEYGCEETLKLTAMNDHLNVCSFRLYYCRLKNCPWEGRRNEIENHWCTQHSQQMCHTESFTYIWRKNNPEHVVKLWKVLNELFYLNIIDKGNAIHFAVQYIGKSEDAIEYYFKLHISSTEFKFREISMVENCQDDLFTTADDVITESGYTISIIKSMFHSFKNEKDEVNCRITIVKE